MGFGTEQEAVVVETPYGSVTCLVETINDHQVFILNRHGTPPVQPPHMISYRANISAISACHVDCLVGIGAVGSLKKQIRPGDLIVPDDFFDATHARQVSFFDTQRVHVDMSESFCPQVRTSLIEQAKAMRDIAVHEKGVYLVTEGPRLETPAEIKMYQPVADIVGMTLVPEVSLARERGLCYASFCLVCNRAAGLQKQLPSNEIAQVFIEKEPLISKILEKVIIHFDGIECCCCQFDVTKASL